MHIRWVKGLVCESVPGFARVALPEFDNIVTPWMPVLKTRAMNDDENWPLEIDEQVHCITDWELTEGVILGAVSSDADKPDSNAGAGKWRKKFSDGTYFEYDKNAHKLTLNISGDADITTTGKITASCREMDVTASGKVVANCNEIDVTAVKASITAPEISLEGNVTIAGNLELGGVIAASPTSAGTIIISSNIVAAGITATLIASAGDVTAGTISLTEHVHGAVQPGTGVSGVPVP